MDHEHRAQEHVGRGFELLHLLYQLSEDHLADDGTNLNVQQERHSQLPANMREQ
jgi:hypothetical protein